MTSIPFTSRRGLCAVESISCLAPRASRLRLAAARLDLLLGRVLLGRRVDHRAQQLGVGLVPVGGVAPPGAVPRMDAGLVRAFMVVARGPDRLEYAVHAEGLDARGVDIQ